MLKRYPASKLEALFFYLYYKQTMWTRTLITICVKYLRVKTILASVPIVF